MSQSNLYGDLLAEVYDLDKPIGAKTPITAASDIPFYLDRLRAIDGPILEPAVGTGRIYLPLVEEGLDVTGFDRSAAMLGYLERYAAERGVAVKVNQATFEDFAYDTPFAAVIIPASSLILVDDPPAAMAVLKRLHDALRPGGLLMLDLPPLDYLTGNHDGVRSWTAANGDLLRLVSQRVELDLMRQRRVNHDRYERWRDGRLVEQVLEVMAYHVFGRLEFELALRQTGFTNIRVSGNYQNRPPRSGDRVVTWEAVKAR